MISIHLNTHNLSSMIRQLHQDVRQFDQRFPRAIERIKNRYYMYLLFLTPVDTGYLISRWRNLPLRKVIRGNEIFYEGIIQNDTYYLYYVNYGFWTVNHKRFINGQFFIEKAFRIIRSQILQEMHP